MPPHARQNPRSNRLHAERLEPRLPLAGDALLAPSAPIGLSIPSPATFSAGTVETTPDRPWIGHAMAAERGAVVFQLRLGAGADGTTTLQTLPIWARLNTPAHAAQDAADTPAVDAITATAFVTSGAGSAVPVTMPLESLLAALPPRPESDVDLFVVVESSSDILLAITAAGVVLAGAPGLPLESMRAPPSDAAAGSDSAPPDGPAPDAAGSATDNAQTVTPSTWLDAILPPASDGLADASGPAAAWLGDARGGDTGAFVLWAVPTAAGGPPLLVPLYARFNPVTAEDPALLPDRPRPATARFHPPGSGAAAIDLDPATALTADTAEGFLVVHTDSNVEIFLGTLLPLFLALADGPGALPDADSLALLAGALLPLPAPPAPEVALLHDTGAHADDRITADGRLAVAELPQTRVEFSADGGRTWQPEHRPASGHNAVLVRRVDAFGRTSEPTAFTFRLDTRAPAVPRPRLADVPMGVHNPVRRHATLAIGGLEAGARVEYSADGGPWHATWTPVEGSNSVRVRQIDLAGNVSAPSPTVRVRIDTVAAPLGVTLARDTGSSPADRITADARLAFSGLEHGATVHYSRDGGMTWTARYRPVEGLNRFLVRQLDAAGNLSAPVAFEFTLDTTKPRGMAPARQPATTDALAVPVIPAATNEHVEYRVGRGPWREDPPAPRTRMTVRVRVVDAAGNVSPVTRLYPPPPGWT